MQYNFYATKVGLQTSGASSTASAVSGAVGAEHCTAAWQRPGDLGTPTMSAWRYIPYIYIPYIYDISNQETWEMFDLRSVSCSVHQKLLLASCIYVSIPLTVPFWTRVPPEKSITAPGVPTSERSKTKRSQHRSLASLLGPPPRTAPNVGRVRFVGVPIRLAGYHWKNQCREYNIVAVGCIQENYHFYKVIQTWFLNL